MRCSVGGGVGGDKLFLAGEMTKAVPISPRRVRSIRASRADVTVQLVGSPGELVRFDVCEVRAPHCSDGDGDSNSYAEHAGTGSGRVDYCSVDAVDVRCRTVNCTIGGSGAATLSALQSVCY